MFAIIERFAVRSWSERQGFDEMLGDTLYPTELPVLQQRGTRTPDLVGNVFPSTFALFASHTEALFLLLFLSVRSL